VLGIEILRAFAIAVVAIVRTLCARVSGWWGAFFFLVQELLLVAGGIIVPSRMSCHGTCLTLASHHMLYAPNSSPPICVRTATVAR
jgi:hypothetical protein